MFSLRGRRITLAVLGWLAAAAGAVAVGLVAVSFLSSGLTEGGARTLSDSEVLRALEQTTRTPRPTPKDTPTPTPTPSPTHTRTPDTDPVVSEPRGLVSRGGTVTARCVDGEPDILGWSPSPGYEADDDGGNPHEVTFEPDDDDANPSVRLRVSCEDNRPVGEPKLSYED